MPIHIEFRDGIPALLIPDASGDCHGYRFTIRRQTGREWICGLTRLDKSREYQVVNYPDSAWSCTCKDAEFRGYMKRNKSACKHILAAQELQQLALCFFTQDEDIRSLIETAKLYTNAHVEFATKTS